MSAARRMTGFVAFAVGISIPTGSLAAQMTWPIPANDTVGDASSITQATRDTVNAFRNYIQQNWSFSAGVHCTQSNYDLIMDALANDTYHWGRSLTGRHQGEYFRKHNVVLNDTLPWDLQVGTVAHEAMHHTISGSYGGFSDSDPQPFAMPGCIQGASDDDDSGGGGGGGNTITITPTDALACNTWGGEGTYYATLTVSVPKCWSGTMVIVWENPNGANVTMSFYHADSDCDGEITFDVCQIPYDWWVDFCW